MHAAEADKLQQLVQHNKSIIQGLPFAPPHTMHVLVALRERGDVSDAAKGTPVESTDDRRWGEGQAQIEC